MITSLNNQAGVKLAKANISLAVRLSELAHQQNSMWMDSLQKNLSGCYSEFEANAKNALSAGDWASMSMAWATMPLLMMKMQTRQIQQMLEYNAKLQQQTNSMLRDGLATWQREAAIAMQEGAGAMPLSTALRNWFDGAALPGAAGGNNTNESASAASMPMRMTEPARATV